MQTKRHNFRAYSCTHREARDIFSLQRLLSQDSCGRLSGPFVSRLCMWDQSLASHPCLHHNLARSIYSGSREVRKLETITGIVRKEILTDGLCQVWGVELLLENMPLKRHV